MKPLLEIEHEVLRVLRRNQLDEAELYVAVSGGVDSVCLASILLALRPLTKINIFIIHIHHGLGPASQLSFRNRAWVMVSEWCQELNVGFHSNVETITNGVPQFNLAPEQELKNESELREFRYSVMRKIIANTDNHRNGGCKTKPCLALAHHSGDQVETQMMRLIRGVGPQGIKAMQVYEDDLFRPLIGLQRKQLEEYALERKLNYLEDPSNKNLETIRNWMRYSWLPQLEERSPGSVRSLASSLEIIGSQQPNLVLDEFFSEEGLDLHRFLGLSVNDKARVIAGYFKTLGIKNYGRTHINEVLKQLDIDKAEHKFRLLKHNWSFAQNKLKASPETGS